MFRENDLSPHNSDNDECTELWVLLVHCLCLVISTSKMATVGGQAERRSTGMHWLDDPRGEEAGIHRSSLQEWWTASGREKVSVKVGPPPCEGEQKAGPECQTQHPAHTA